MDDNTIGCSEGGDPTNQLYWYVGWLVTCQTTVCVHIYAGAPHIKAIGTLMRSLSHRNNVCVSFQTTKSGQTTNQDTSLIRRLSSYIVCALISNIGMYIGWLVTYLSA